MMMKKIDLGKLNVKIETRKKGVVRAYNPTPLFEWLPTIYRSQVLIETMHKIIQAWNLL